MTIPRLNAIAKRWKAVPPVSVSIAAIASGLGVLETGKPKENNLESLMSDVAGAGLSMEKPAWLTK